MSGLLGALILGAALLFNEGRSKHAWCYIVAAGALFLAALFGVQ